MSQINLNWCLFIHEINGFNSLSTVVLYWLFQMQRQTGKYRSGRVLYILVDWNNLLIAVIVPHHCSFAKKTNCAKVIIIVISLHFVLINEHMILSDGVSHIVRSVVSHTKRRLWMLIRSRCKSQVNRFSLVLWWRKICRNKIIGRCKC